MRPADYPPAFYSFQRYNTKHRMLTYWHQIRAILNLSPSSVLEIGVGTGLVSAYLRSVNITVSTLDINPGLKPDRVGSVLDMESLYPAGSFDLVLCARVLHHLPYGDFDRAIAQIARVTSGHAVVTLPIDDFRIYFMTRWTSSNIYTGSIGLPLALKRLALKRRPSAGRANSLWKVDDGQGPSLRDVGDAMSKHFSKISGYRIPEDSAHYLSILTK